MAWGSSGAGRSATEVCRLLEAGERKLDAQQEAMLVALACSKPPKGRRRWTLHLLAEELVELCNLPSLSHETVQRRLAENEFKPWQKKMWSLPRVDAAFVAQMEDIWISTPSHQTSRS